MASDCGKSPTFSQTHVFKPGTEQADLYGVMALVDTLPKPRPDLTDQLWTTFTPLMTSLPGSGVPAQVEPE